MIFSTSDSRITASRMNKAIFPSRCRSIIYGFGSGNTIDSLFIFFAFASVLIQIEALIAACSEKIQLFPDFIKRLQGVIIAPVPGFHGKMNLIPGWIQPLVRQVL